MNQLFLRFANEEDKEDVFIWRNDPESIKYSPSGKVNPEEHNKWYSQKIKDSQTQLFIITDEKGNKIGTIRFDFNNINSQEISIALNPKFRGKGLGTKSLRLGVHTYFNNYNIKEITARVLNNNLASIKIFEKVGFKKIKEEKSMIEYAIKKNEIRI